MAALRAGASPFDTDLSGHNALMLAVAHAQDDLGIFLLGAMAHAAPDLLWLRTSSSSTGLPVLAQAVRSGRARIWTAVLGLSADPELVLQPMAGGEGDTAMHWAARENVHRAIRPLLKAAPEARDQPNIAGLSPLDLAVANDSNEVFDALLQNGAKVTEGEFPAWMHVDSAVMWHRLESKMDWSVARTAQGATALHTLAARLKNRSALWRLALRTLGEIQANLTDVRGRTPLHMAVCPAFLPSSEAGPSLPSASIVDDLVLAGASWHHADQDGETPADLMNRLAPHWPPGLLDDAGRWKAQAVAQELDQSFAAPNRESLPHRL